MINAPSKSVTKSIVRTMQMNGTLDSHPAKKADAPNNIKQGIKDRGDEEDEDEDESDDGNDEDENEEETVQQVKKGEISCVLYRNRLITY